jgi:hypothetical protein
MMSLYLQYLYLGMVQIEQQLPLARQLITWLYNHRLQQADT